MQQVGLALGVATLGLVFYGAAGAAPAVSAYRSATVLAWMAEIGLPFS